MAHFLLFQQAMLRCQSTHLKSPQKILGFTVPEVVVAGCVLALFIATSVAAMTQINRWAASSRLHTLALALAQQKVDQILSTPWSVLSTAPTLLTAGTTTENNLPLNNDSFNNETGLSSAFTNLDVQVNATRTTVITSISTRQVSAAVTVTYTYRKRTTSIVMNTLRTTDDF